MAPQSHKALTGQIDRTGDRAVFRQIADHLRAVIVDGTLGPGEQLPSEAAMQAHYGVQKMTARAALDLLKGEGLVVSEHGRGVFVRARPPIRRLAGDRFSRAHRAAGRAAFLAEVEESGARPGVDSIQVEFVTRVPESARRLTLGPRERVLVRRRRYLIDGHPVEVATSYLPGNIAKGTPIAEVDTGPGGIYARLEELGHRLDHFREEIHARMPDHDEAKALQLGSGVPVFHLIRTAFDANGAAVEVCDTVMSSDAYVLDYELPAR